MLINPLSPPTKTLLCSVQKMKGRVPVFPCPVIQKSWDKTVSGLILGGFVGFYILNNEFEFLFISYDLSKVYFEAFFFKHKGKKINFVLQSKLM